MSRGKYQRIRTFDPFWVLVGCMLFVIATLAAIGAVLTWTVTR